LYYVYVGRRESLEERLYNFHDSKCQYIYGVFGLMGERNREKRKTRKPMNKFELNPFTGFQ
jgi:hypothetical protein